MTQPQSKSKRKTSSSLPDTDKPEVSPQIVRSEYSVEDIKVGDLDINEDILKLAKLNDSVKTSRQELMFRMSTLQKSTARMIEAPIVPDEEQQKHSSAQEASTSINNSRSQPKAAAGEFTKDLPEESCNENKVVSSESCDDVDENIEEDVGKEPATRNIPQTVARCPVNRTSNEEFGIRMNITLPKMTFRNPFKNSNVKALQPVLPSFEGYLKKKSTNMLKLWQKRYFALVNRKLYYYKTDKKTITAGCIDFDLISVEIELSSDKRHIKITPLGGQRNFHLKAKTSDEGQKWTDALKSHQQTSVGFSSKLSKTVALRNFWKYDRISEMKFMEQADTGDLLLFRTKNFGAKVQRSFTRSDYDHVALILKYGNGELVLFEATGKQGVGLCRWKTFMKSKWHQLYSKISYRKLTANRTQQMVLGVQKFVRYSVGKKYEVNAKKLFQKKASTDEEENQQNRTFFCSELIAACYKKINILPQDISASCYLPGNFAAEKKLELLNDCKLGPENLVDFTL